jgi:hypothetical protein
VLLFQLLSVFGMWLMTSQTWASATITESQMRVEVSGLEAYPQITVSLVVWLLLVFVAGYVKSFFGRFLLSAVSILTTAILSPTWFESASGSLSILSPKIGKLTGVSDWATQGSLISNESYNHLAADLFIIFLIIAFASSITRYWLPSKGTRITSLKTRIDDLPRW